MSKRRLLLDLNCDLGEDETVTGIARDRELLRYVTSANIACGGHAGSPDSMRRMVEACRHGNVRIGAHPGYEDRANFGRTELAVDADELRRSVAKQIAALQAICSEFGTAITHVKPHGALYHAAMHRGDVADAILIASRELTPAVALVGMAGRSGTKRWMEAGGPVESEAFADRRYEPDGELRARRLPGAVLEDPEAAAEQARCIAADGLVQLDTGGRLPVRATTLCVHSDSPNAVAIAQAVAAAIEISP